MVLYTCRRCGYTTKQRSDFRKHLTKRKVECPPTNSSIDTKTLLYEVENGFKSYDQIIINKDLSNMNQEEIRELQIRVENYLKILETYLIPNVDVNNCNSFGEESLDHINESDISYILSDIRLDINKDKWYLFGYLLKIIYYRNPTNRSIYFVGDQIYVLDQCGCYCC